MADLFIIIIVFVLLRSAIRFIIKEKKKGTRCIGCPDAGSCSRKCSGCAGGTCGKDE